MGRLAQSSIGGASIRFAYDGLSMIAEHNGAGALLRRYVPGPSMDEPVAWYEGSGTSDRRFFIADERGSVIAITNASGAASTINSYDEYGTPGASNQGRFQFTGQAWMPEAGLYHFKARTYSFALGRFLQTDPILYEGGMSLYVYVNNDPVNRVDLLGLQEANSCYWCLEVWQQVINGLILPASIFGGPSSAGGTISLGGGGAATDVEGFDVFPEDRCEAADLSSGVTVGSGPGASAERNGRGDSTVMVGAGAGTSLRLRSLLPGWFDGALSGAAVSNESQHLRSAEPGVPLGVVGANAQAGILIGVYASAKMTSHGNSIEFGFGFPIVGASAFAGLGLMTLGEGCSE